MSKRWGSLKMVLVLTLAATMVLSWVAFSAAETITIRWAIPSWFGVKGFETDEMAIKLFEQENPGIKVEHRPLLGEWQDKIFAQMAAGTAPDVISGQWGSGLAYWIDAGQALLLEEYFPKEYREKSSLSPAQLNISCSDTNGRLCAITLHGGGLPWLLYYNMEKFDEVGVPYPDDTWNWNSLLGAAKKLTKKGEGGKKDQFGYQVSHYLYWSLHIFIWQNGGRIVPEGQERSATKILIDQPKALEAIQFNYDMMWKDHVSPTPAQMGDLQLWNTFLFGQVAMQINGSGDMSFNERDCEFRWDIARLPKGPTGIRANPCSSGGTIIYAGTKYPEEAVRFIKFFHSSEEVGELYAKRHGSFPFLKSLNAKFRKYSPFYGKFNTEGFEGEERYGHVVPAFTKGAKVDELLNPALEKIFVLGNPVEETIKEVCQNINRVLAEAE